MADALSLQDIDLVETPAEEYHSTNSVYACVLMSQLSIGC